MENKNLSLSVYERYFNAIENGTKQVEYREANNPYWVKKLVDLSAYPGKTPEEVMDGLLNGKLEIKPIKYDTMTFYTTKGGRRVNLVIQWADTVVHPGHKYFAIRMGDLLRDSNGNKPKPKNK